MHLSYNSVHSYPSEGLTLLHNVLSTLESYYLRKHVKLSASQLAMSGMEKASLVSKIYRSDHSIELPVVQLSENVYLLQCIPF